MFLIWIFFYSAFIRTHLVSKIPPKNHLNWPNKKNVEIKWSSAVLGFMNRVLNKLLVGQTERPWEIQKRIFDDWLQIPERPETTQKTNFLSTAIEVRTICRANNRNNEEIICWVCQGLNRLETLVFPTNFISQANRWVLFSRSGSSQESEF